MIRLIALNENVHQEECDDKVTETDEAQVRGETHKNCGNHYLERIAQEEYFRAMRLMNQGKEELALSLLNDLLETKVLNEAPTAAWNLNLLGIRHNCYKNAGIIYDKAGDIEKALKYFVLAIKLDEDNVHAMTRLGKLALKSNFLEMAEFVFYGCLKHNSNHWLAADAILRLFCQYHNVLGAYAWATRIHSRDPRCQLAIDIISEINHTFSADINFFKKIWNESPSIVKKYECRQDRFQINEWYSLKKSFLPVKEDLKIQFSNWLSIENYILLANRYHHRSKSSIFFVFKRNYLQTRSDDDFKNVIVLEEEYNVLVNKNNYIEDDSLFPIEYSIDRNEVKNKFVSIEMADKSMQELDNYVTPAVDGDNIKNWQQTRQSEQAIEDSELNSKSDSNDSNKIKCKRRCSDLHFLEQWSWHKNRRYSSRKKIQDRSKADTTLKEYLERIFSSYLKLSFDQFWPLSCEDSHSAQVEERICSTCSKGVKTVEEFFIDTQNEFYHFKDSLKKNSFDIISLVFTWLKYLSEFWNVFLPEEVQRTYHEICKFYINHFDLTALNQCSREDFISSYKIFLLYLEIDFQLTANKKSETNVGWRKLFDCLMCNAGSQICAEDLNFDSNMIRLLNLAYKFTKYESDLKKSESYLDSLESLFERFSSSFVFHSPNLKNSCLDKNIIFMKRNATKRKLALNQVPQLFAEKNWPQLVTIISDNLMNTIFVNDCDYWKRDLKTQFEIIIQASWNINNFEACLKWSEKYFHLSASKYLNKAENINQHFWEQSINYAISYIECLAIHEGYGIFDCLGKSASRLVQNIIKILTLHLDTPYDKHAKALCDLNIKRLWVCLHQVILRDEQTNVSKKNNSYESNIDAAEIDDMIPHSFLILFTAHEFLGKRKWCSRENGALLRYILDTITPTLRAPSHDSYRDIAYEYIEQVTYCLYGFPTKKTRRNLEDHESRPIELKLSTAIQLFDIYRPESLPEFNSYKLESVSGDMEQLLVKIATLVLKEINTTPATSKIMQYINGDSNELLRESGCIKLPYKISSIFYLLADYYFKNRDFSKTIKYYTLDLACNPNHLDSWAGMALSKASKIESQLNDFFQIETSSFLSECENIIRCFEQCRLLNPTHTLLWIEYGSFAYTIYSFCSRQLKQLSPKMSIAEFTHIEKQKEKMLNIAFNCFSSANNLQNTWIDNEINAEETHDEKWLCRYMLGKITEKRKEQPRVFLNHYLKAAHYLYESNATYPIKINHSNPTPLSVEALEVYYRTNSSILKFLESESVIDRETGDFFTIVLKNLSSSPFAFNKAKIDGNSLCVLKRSLKNKSDDHNLSKMPKIHYPSYASELEDWTESYKDDVRKESARTEGSSILEIVKQGSTFRHHSVTSSSDSVSDSDTEINSGTKKSIPYTKEELNFIYNAIVNNLEECITRFPEHFKSIYRLVFHYMNAPDSMRDLDRCEKLLLGQYTTRLGNQINGIFCDRKSNNIFNGIWRLPSSEIDRPGSFSTHMVKCVSILIQMLVKQNNHKLLIEIGLQLFKTPDSDKRYIKDAERLELHHQSIYFCVQIVRDILKKNTIIRDNNEIMSILIDIYKAHKKCLKHMNEKEPLLSQLLIDIYKFYMHNKVSSMPENSNIIEIVIKFCAQEVNLRKNQGKQNTDSTKQKNLQNMVLGMNKTSAVFEKDLQSMTKLPESNHAQVNTSKQFSTEPSNTLFNEKNLTLSRNLCNLPNFPSVVNAFRSAALTNDSGYTNLVAEYCKLLEIHKEGREKSSSFEQYSSETNSYHAAQKDVQISEHLSEIPELKITHFSEFMSFVEKKQQTSTKLPEIPSTVYQDGISDNVSIVSQRSSKEESSSFLIPEKLISPLTLSSANDAPKVVSSEINYYPNFQQTKTYVENSGIYYSNNPFSIANSTFETILKSAEYNKPEEKDSKCRVNTCSTKVKHKPKPYNREFNSPSAFLNNQQVKKTGSLKNNKSSSILGATQKIAHMDSQKYYPHDSKLNPNIYKAFLNDKVTMHSLLTSSNPITMQSILNSPKQSLSDNCTTLESSAKQFNSGMEMPYSDTSSHETVFKANEDISKLSASKTLPQLLNRQKYNESKDAAFSEATSTNLTSAIDVIILD